MDWKWRRGRGWGWGGNRHTCIFFFSFWLHCTAWGISPTRIAPMPPAAETQSLNRWSTTEVQLTCVIKLWRCTYAKPTQQLHKKLIWDKNSEQYPYYENPQILNIHPCFLVVCLSGAFRSFGVAQAAVVISREILQGESALLILAKQTCLSFLEIWKYAACLGGREEWRVNLISLTAQDNPVYMEQGQET